MSLFRNQNLFASGAHMFHVHGLAMRHESVELTGVDGVRIVALGRTARHIYQFGTLYADAIAPLQQQLDAIEAAMDGLAGDLVDDLGRVWPRMVLIRLRLRRVRRIGLRLAVEYAIRYVQVQPPEVPLPSPLPIPPVPLVTPVPPPAGELIGGLP